MSQPEWLLPYLRDRGVLDPAAAIAGTVRTDDVSVSHTSVRVSVDGTPRWFVKCADPVRSRGRDLGTEPFVYRLATSHPALAGVVPRCRVADDRHQVIVLDIVPGESLDFERVVAAGTPHGEVLRHYGVALAAVHSVRPQPFGGPPWLLVALEPRWGNYEWLPRACGTLLRRLSADRSFNAGFRRARQRWTLTGLIHGDVRWANVIVDLRAPSDLRLVDWELACVGDAAWDVGSVLADIVAARTLWSPARRPETAFDSAAVFLSGYRSAMELPRESWRHLVERAVRLSGVRLVQNVIEHGYVAPGDIATAAGVLLPWASMLLNRAAAIAERLALPEPAGA